MKQKEDKTHILSSLDQYPLLKSWFLEYKDRHDHNPRYYIRTFGCQQNDADSEIMAGIMESIGFTPANSYSEGDLILINTCSVRENADERFFGHLGGIKRYAGQEEKRIIGVCGCMMTQDIHINRIKQSFPFVDFLLRPDQISFLPEFIENGLRQKEVFYANQEGTPFHENMPIARQRRYRALVSIMYGCNNFCSYCIVPYTRGRERSRPPENILKEISEVAASGIPEVMLLGQNVNAWGKDLKEGQEELNFAWLLREASAISGIRRIRFMTSHPKDLSAALIETIGDYEVIEPHVHLPLQSGSNRILEKMNRKYTREKYLDIVKRLRAARPGISISTDIIVGFPGEEETDFFDTIDIMNQVRFDSAFTFIYSPRAGTPAAKCYDPNNRDIVQKRFEYLVELQNKHSLHSNQKQTGKVVEVLCEGVSSGNKNILSGRTADNRLVNFVPKEPNGSAEIAQSALNMSSREGEFIDVFITTAKTFSLEGREV